MTPLPEFMATPLRVRIWVCSVVPLALALSLLLSTWPTPTISSRDLYTALVLVIGSVLNVEIGRLFEGGRVAQQRPHKALSAWPMAATILLPSFYLVPIVALIYAHARWRGVRVAMFRWVLSGAILVWAGAISGTLVVTDANGSAPSLDSGPAGMVLLLGVVLVFLAVETAMLAICSRLNSEPDELWLRKTLIDPAFYLTEAGVLCIGALTALIGANEPWFVFLLIPVYAFLQMSVLHRPLQELATRDSKTGLLHFNAWQRLASEEIRRLNSGGHPWAVLFADIDNFRFYNQRHGHLGGDDAIHLVAQIITSKVRPKDVTARFGGEEFCVLLPETLAATAEQVAERIRLAIAKETSSLPESVTVSVGVAAIEGGRTPMELAVVLALADEALYAAKLAGRNTVRVRAPITSSGPPISDGNTAQAADGLIEEHRIMDRQLEQDRLTAGQLDGVGLDQARAELGRETGPG
ncbi:MAG: GGDEF domain-containing protein [Nakamurella sp.]